MSSAHPHPFTCQQDYLVEHCGRFFHQDYFINTFLDQCSGKDGCSLSGIQDQYVYPVEHACTKTDSIFFVQYQCLQPVEDLEQKQTLTLYAVCVTIFVDLLFLILLNYM